MRHVWISGISDIFQNEKIIANVILQVRFCWCRCRCRSCCISFVVILPHIFPTLVQQNEKLRCTVPDRERERERTTTHFNTNPSGTGDTTTKTKKKKQKKAEHCELIRNMPPSFGLQVEEQQQFNYSPKIMSAKKTTKKGKEPKRFILKETAAQVNSLLW